MISGPLTRRQPLEAGGQIRRLPDDHPKIDGELLIFNWAQGRSWRSLRDYRLMYGIVVAAGIAVLAVQGARGRSPLGVLGAYEVAGQTHYRFWDVFRWFWYAVGELDLSLGVLPFAGLIILTAVARGQDRRVQAFVAASLGSGEAPSNTPNMIATSITYLAIGPAVSWSAVIGITP